jgi:hypothetical protein
MSVIAALAYQSVTSVHTDAGSCRLDRDVEKRHLVNLLAAAGLHERAVSVGQCCEQYRALGCASGHTFNPVPTYRCRYRLCVDCARERQRRAYSRLWPILHGFQRAYPHDRPILITLTVKSTFDQLRVIDMRVKGWFRNLRRSVVWKHRIRGAVAGFEMTYNPQQGWHYHIHILAFRKVWYDQAELAEQWCRITKGAGQIVDIQSKGKLSKMVDEVLKYCFKPANLNQWDIQQVREFDGLRGIKLSDCYGELRGLKVESDEDLTGPEMLSDPHRDLGYGSPCPDCGEPLRFVTVPRSLLCAPPDDSS